ncbi:MAG TPA: GSCFA domain protein [Bacteroidales bacterium]|nr:GSCFA domain protein [Bacteroidales bacterium]
MEFRTTFKIDPSVSKISYRTPVMFIGSCFAAAVGSRMQAGNMPVMINPAGTVYNPVSVSNTINSFISPARHDPESLFRHGSRWISFDHYTDFSSDDPQKVIERINRREEESRLFISDARFLFITFGTARVSRWKKSGRIVSNCHKIPASYFSHELLTPDEIASLWSGLLDNLKASFPELKVVFTISPVRHWKDGAHGNQVSKSVLFLAVEKLLCHPAAPAYFPAYELVMDDLRDYRFYGADMLHLSDTAVDYIWEAFTRCYFDDSSRTLWHEVEGISKAVSHRILTDDRNEIWKFAEGMLEKIAQVKSRFPSVSLDRETNYFRGLLSEGPDPDNKQ